VNAPTKIDRVIDAMADLSTEVPRPIEFENALIGAVLIGALVPPTLRPEDFSLDGNRIVWGAIEELRRRDGVYDEALLSEYLRTQGSLEAVGGREHLLSCTECACTPSMVNAYVSRVKEAARHRSMIAVALQLVDAGLKGTALDAEALEEMVQPIMPEVITIDTTTCPTSGFGAGTFLRLKAPTPEVLVKGILSSGGSGWIAGPEKTGKSLYALDEALGLTLALPVAGRFEVAIPRRVWFISEEDTLARVQNRIGALLRGRGLDPAAPRVQERIDAGLAVKPWSGFSLDNRGMQEMLRLVCRDWRPAVVYLDVLRKVTSADLNRAAEVNRLLNFLDELRRSFEVVFRVLHHNRKPVAGQRGARRGSTELAGSYNLGAWGESSLFFDPAGPSPLDGARVTLQSKDLMPRPDFILKTHAEGPEHWPDLYRLTAEDVPSKATKPEPQNIEETILKAVPELAQVEPGEDGKGKPGATIEAIAKVSQKSDKTTRDAVRALVNAGRLEVVGKTAKGGKLYQPTKQV